MHMRKIEIIIEKADDGLLWGRLNYNNNLITDSGGSVQELESSLRNLLHDFEGVEPKDVVFEYYYDVYAIFKKFDFLKISSVAEYAGINPGLLRQYASGVKNPGRDQARKIEDTFHRLADALQQAHLGYGLGA